MRISFNLIFFLFSLSLFSQSSSITQKVSQIEYLLEESHSRGFFNGNVLVAMDDNIIYQSAIGFAKADKSEKLTKDHVFRIGSVSKEFDGVALMLLCEQNKVSLNDTLSQFFPSLGHWADKIQLNHLLNYTSGLPGPSARQIQTDEDAWECLAHLETLNFEPGSDYLYSNLNTFLRKRIVEKVTGDTFSDFIKKNLIEKVGMEEAIIDPDPENPSLPESFDSEFVKDDSQSHMSGWVALTMGDLEKWISGLHDGEIISHYSLAKLAENFKNKQSTLGTVAFQEGNIHYQYHHGQSGSFEASFYYNPIDKFTVIFLTNQRGNNLGDLTNAVDAILRGEKFHVPKKSIELSLRSKILHQGYEEGMEFYNNIREDEFEIYDFENEQKELLETAEYLILKGKRKDAIKLLRFTASRFPESSSAIEQLQKLEATR